MMIEKTMQESVLPHLIDEGEQRSERNNRARAGYLPNPHYLSVKETARLLGLSERCVYSYLASGKLPGERIGQTIVVRKATLPTFQRPAVGRPRRRTPIWRKPVADNPPYLLSLRVPLRADQEQGFLQQLSEMRLKRQHQMPGTVARYISRNIDTPAEIQFTLLWRQRTMPAEAERQAALAALRADFSDVLDWEHASVFEGPVALNT